jgi:hypothetical protein
MNHLLILLTGLIILALGIIAFCHSKSNSISATRAKLHVNANAKSSDDELIGALSNVSFQISSYVGYDPTGGHYSYNSAAFVQYVNSAIQLLHQAQSSGSINTELGQYISKLLSQVSNVTPLEKSSFDEQEMGIIAGQLSMATHALTNGIEWEGASSGIIQDAQHAVDTYQAWLGGSLTTAAAAAYMNDPVVYNLKLDNDGYPPSITQSLPTDIAEVDAWYWSNGDTNRPRIWFDLGMFIGFGCIYTSDGNTCA